MLSVPLLSCTPPPPNTVQASPPFASASTFSGWRYLVWQRARMTPPPTPAMPTYWWRLSPAWRPIFKGFRRQGGVGEAAGPRRGPGRPRCRAQPVRARQLLLRDVHRRPGSRVLRQQRDGPSPAVQRKWEVIGEPLSQPAKLDPTLATLSPNLPRIVSFRNQPIRDYATVKAGTLARWHVGTLARCGTWLKTRCPCLFPR